MPSAAPVSPDVKKISTFDVPVFASRVGDGSLNVGLREAVLRMRADSPGVTVSNRGGWHSERDLQDWPDPAVGRLLGHIDAVLSEVVRQTVDDPGPELLDGWLIRAWANVNTRGASNDSHSHFWGMRRTAWSGVYYVDPGSSSSGAGVEGETVFEDRVGVPRPIEADGRPFGGELTVTPEAGMLLLFPGTLRHRVEPYRGDSERITIAWNLYHPRFAVPLYSDDGVREVGLVLPARLRRLGSLIERVVPPARGRVEYAEGPHTYGGEWARSFRRELTERGARPLRNGARA